MTYTSGSDNDTCEVVEDSLTPIEKYIYNYAKRNPDLPFCFLDFTKKYAHGSIRNAFLSLKKRKLIALYCRSGPAFYMLVSSKLKVPPSKMTVHRRGGRYGVGVVRIDFGAFLDSLEWEDVCRVHDVTLVFPAGVLYRLFLAHDVGRLLEVSGDIRFGSFVWSRGRVLKVFLHRGGKVVACLRCSECPVEVSLDGLVSLSSFLGGVRFRLVDAAVSVEPTFDEKLVPDVPDWTVAQWHYGRDGAGEISGPAFNVTFKTWFGELARIYMRRHGRLLKPRLEIHERPRKPLAVAFAEKIDPFSKVEGV